MLKTEETGRPNSGDIKNEIEFLLLIIIYIILKTDSKKYDS